MPKLHTDGRALWISAEPREHTAVKMVPGATWAPKHLLFKARLSWISYAQLWAIFGDTLELDPEVLEWATAEAERRRQITYLGAQLDVPPGWDFLGTERARDLYPPQRVGSEYLLLAGGAILGDDMGGGKTPQLCVAIRELFEAGHKGRVLIIASRAALEQTWVPHVREWVGVEPGVMLGDVKQRRAVLDSEARVMLTTYGLLSTHTKLARYGSLAYKRCADCLGPTDAPTQQPVKPTRCEAHPKELNAAPLLAVVVDEAHLIKDPTTAQTRACKAVLWPARYRWVATGTPTANHEADFWSLLNAVAPNDWPSRSQFIDRYCSTFYTPEFGNLTITGLKPETRAEFHALTASVMLRRPRAVLAPWLPKALPPVVREVELGVKVRKHYDELRKELITELDSGVLVAANAAVRFGRLHQLASADLEQVGEDDYRMVEPSCKLDELEAILAELPAGEPVVVFARNRQLIELAEVRLAKSRYTSSSYHGGQLDIENANAMAHWQAGHTQVLLATLAKGSESLTLTRSHIIVYLQESTSFLEMQQSRDRIDRIGQTLPPLHIYIRAARTIDTRVVAMLTDKGDRFEELVQDVERLKAML